jgi:hypothetical protein
MVLQHGLTSSRCASRRRRRRHGSGISGSLIRHRVDSGILVANGLGIKAHGRFYRKLTAMMIHGWVQQEFLRGKEKRGEGGHGH